AGPAAVPGEQDLGVADHDVKRRAQLVGHAGDELRLEAARGEALLVESLQLLGALGDLCLELPGPREAAIGARPLAPELAEDMPVEESARVEEEEAEQVAGRPQERRRFEGEAGTADETAPEQHDGHVLVHHRPEADEEEDEEKLL